MTIQEIFAHIDELFENKKAEAVEPFILQQLSEAEQAGDGGKIVPLCNELGGFYRATGRYDEGVPLYEKALAALSRQGLQNTDSHATTLMNYATTYAVKGEPQRGLELFEQAEEIFEACALNRDYRMATLHNNMSILCQDLGDTAEAAAHLQEALSILKSLEGSEPEIAITYTNLAQIHLLAGDIEQAMEDCEKALDTFPTDEDVHYSAAIETRGQIYLAQGDSGQALEDFRTALALMERDYGSDNPSCAALREIVRELESGEVSP